MVSNTILMAHGKKKNLLHTTSQFLNFSIKNSKAKNCSSCIVLWNCQIVNYNFTLCVQKSFIIVDLFRNLQHDRNHPYYFSWKFFLSRIKACTFSIFSCGTFLLRILIFREFKHFFVFKYKEYENNFSGNLQITKKSVQTKNK